MKSKQIILLGPPGIDVEEQGIALAKRWYVPYIDIEKLFQDEIKKGSELGEEIGACLSASDEAVPDGLVMKLMRRRIEQPDTTGRLGFDRVSAIARAGQGL